MQWSSKTKSALFSIPVFLFLILLVLISVGPFLWVALSSFKTNREILTFSLGGGFHIRNYFNAFKIAPIAQYFMNSIVVTGLGILLNLVIMSMAAYVLARFEFPFRGLVRSFLPWGCLFPGRLCSFPCSCPLRP